ncbi:anthocyanidin 3-o-glucosyltransferase 6 [Nicotiana attenuata]|uniref:Anthocyanidin 3-o-glucosyltransferase 6 n=1 Tax=Nicotiana attenuata TaxID=49451 RepID=A0A1J6KAZ4_NICAT|nr:anthocyanidin 3-o-glucosyltransferase 6 [Nicotiana attenuata]
MLCAHPLMDVATEFGIPGYVFFTSPADFLGLMLHFQILDDECNKDVSQFKNANSWLSFPSYAYPVPPSVLQMVLVGSDTWLVSGFLEFARGYRKAKGIIINTFTELETHALDACKNNISRSGQLPLLPSIYSVGPIMNQSKSSRTESEETKIIKWLDQQPPESVVLICFGSQGSLSVEQVKEIALALQHSGYRFFWSLRQPPEESSNDKNAQFPGEYMNYFEILPKGFLERTVKKGKVVGWVPQFKVLSHEAIGGIRVTLRLEFYTGKHMVWGAYSNMAIALRTTGCTLGKEDGS